VTEVVAWAAGNGVAVKTPTISTASGGTADRWADSLSHEANRSRGVVNRKLRERGRRRQAFFGATVRYANAAGAERVVSWAPTRSISTATTSVGCHLWDALMKSAAGDVVFNCRAVQNT
jgi:transcription elongation factor GreB